MNLRKNITTISDFELTPFTYNISDLVTHSDLLIKEHALEGRRCEVNVLSIYFSCLFQVKSMMHGG